MQLRQKLKNMRRPSEKGDQKEREELQLEDLPGDEGDFESDKDEVMVENEGSLIDDDEDQGGSHLQILKPPPKVPHKKIKLSVDTQKEMNQLEAELQKANPDKKFVKKAMDTTFLQRRSWIQKSVHLYTKYYLNIQYSRNQNM